jgi:hypothetical protein
MHDAFNYISINSEAPSKLALRMMRLWRLSSFFLLARIPRSCLAASSLAWRISSSSAACLALRAGAAFAFAALGGIFAKVTKQTYL